MVKNLLSSIRLFQGLAPEELDALQKAAKEVKFAGDAVIFKQGDPGDKMYLILEGVVEIWKSEGNEFQGSRLARLKSGDIFGEMSLFDKEPRSATAMIALAKEARMLVWEEKEFLDLVRRDPALGIKLLMNFLKEISGRLRVANDAIHTLLRSNQFIGL